MNRVVTLNITAGSCLRTLLLVTLTLNITACGWLFGDEGMFRDRGEDYRKARVEPQLDLPEDMQNPAMEGNYAIPPISDQSKLESEFVVPRPESLAEEAERDNVRINRLGDQQWILVNDSPGEVWPRLRGFLDLNQLALARTDAVSGLLETVWMQPSVKGSLKERYRLRIEQGVQRGTCEVYVLQADLRAGKDEWPAVSTDPEREKLMTQELSQYLADRTSAASVSMLAQQAIDSSGRVSIEQPNDGDPYLKLDLPFSRAWASLNLSAKKAGFTVDDLDRSQRLLYVNYIAADADEDEDGFFSWGSDEPPEGIDYLVKMQEISSETVIITVIRADDEPMQEGEAAHLLKLIKKYLA